TFRPCSARPSAWTRTCSSTRSARSAGKGGTMAQGARVTSILAVADFREALCAFGASGRDALAGVDMQVRPAVDWLTDQTKFWQLQIRKCQEEVLRAKMELEQRKMENRDGCGRGTSEPEKNLRRAQERLRHAEERLANCRRWLPHL